MADEFLSRDVLRVIFSQLDIQSLVSTSLTCRRFYDACRPYLFARLHLNWQEIEDIAAAVENDESVDHRVAHIRELVISGDKRGEWKTSPKLSVIDSLGNLEKIEIECALKSSGWLKYIACPLNGVKTLCLSNNDNFLKTFDFAHVGLVMPNLESVVLKGGFTIDPCVDEGLCFLRHIEVTNCEWHYPSRLTDAAANSHLETLKIQINTYLHPFAFSERLRAEFKSLPLSLKQLEVLVDVGRRLNWNPLHRSRPLPELREVSLMGFSHDTCFPSSKFPHLELLEEI